MSSLLVGPKLVEEAQRRSTIMGTFYKRWRQVLCAEHCFILPLLREVLAAEIVGSHHRRFPDLARNALKAIAAPTTPMLHFNAGWVSSQVRWLLGTACSPNSPSTRSCPFIGVKSPSGSAASFGSSVI
jgi:hypothetical protein